MSLIQTHLAWRGLIVDQASQVTRLPLEVPIADEEPLQIAIHAQLGYFALRLDQMLTGFAHRIGAASGVSADAIAVLEIVPGHEDRNADLSPRTLVDLALSFMGEGRYKNHRGMRTAPHNKATQHGALSVLELLHGPIMGLAQEIRKQMFDDGFLYIPAPGERDAYAALRATMAPGRVIEPAVLVGMQAVAFSPQILAQIDVHLRHTFLPDKIAVAVDKGAPAPMGFIVDRQGCVLDHELVRGIMIMELLRRGGFHGLSEEEQDVLQNEHFRFTEASRLDQAMALNGVLSVLSELADHHGLQIPDGEAKIVRLHRQLHDPRLGDTAQNLLMCDAVRRIIGCLHVLREDERATMGLTPPLRYRQEAEQSAALLREIALAFDFPQILRDEGGMCLPDLSDAHRLACIVACLAIVGGAVARQRAHRAGIAAASVLERHAFALAGRASGQISPAQAWQALDTIQEVLQPGEAAATIGWERIDEMIGEIKKQIVAHLDRSISLTIATL